MNFKNVIGKKERNIKKKLREKEIDDLLKELIFKLKNKNKNKKSFR